MAYDKDETNESSDDSTLEEIFLTESTLAIKVGLTYDEYWSGDVEIFEAYSIRYLDAAKASYAEQDTLAWMIGHYAAYALGACFSKSVKYPDSPVFYPEIDEHAKEKQQERELRKQHAILLAAAKHLGVSVE